MLTLLTAGWLELCLQPLAALCEFALLMPTAEAELSLLSNTLCQNALALVWHSLKHTQSSWGTCIKLAHLCERSICLERYLTSSK